MFSYDRKSDLQKTSNTAHKGDTVPYIVFMYNYYMHIIQ